MVSLSSALDLDTARIVVIQPVRFLALALSVPVVATAFGDELSDQIMPPSAPMALKHLGLLRIAGLIIGHISDRIGLPAALDRRHIRPMFRAQHRDLARPTGPWLTFLGLMTVGKRIGARVDGVGKSALLKFSVAGPTLTVITTAMAVAAALPMAYTLGLDPTHVLIVFAVGGLETMMAMGVVLGASSGFVAAFHFARLLILTIVIPAFVGRIKRS